MEGSPQNFKLARQMGKLASGGSKTNFLVVQETMQESSVEEICRLTHETQQQSGRLTTIQPAADSLSNQTAAVSVSA